MADNIIIYGGSFDPIHLGHLTTAKSVQNYFKFERFIFLPCKTPLLKKPTTASSEQRLRMLELALEPYPQFQIDSREIRRTTPSFMVDTLQSFRYELGYEIAITLLLGKDAFLQLPQWHSWRTILTLSHVLVMDRVQKQQEVIPELLIDLLKTHQTTDKNYLLTKACGKIYQYNAGHIDISSTQLRKKQHLKDNIQAYVPKAVYQYIQQENIYD